MITTRELAQLLAENADGVSLVELDDGDTIARIEGEFDLQAVVDKINGEIPKTGFHHSIGANGEERHRASRRRWPRR